MVWALVSSNGTSRLTFYDNAQLPIKAIRGGFLIFKRHISNTSKSPTKENMLAFYQKHFFFDHHLSALGIVYIGKQELFLMLDKKLMKSILKAKNREYDHL